MVWCASWSEWPGMPRGSNPAGLINTFKQAIIDGTTVEELYWQNIMSPYPSRESDILYMLKPLVK